MTESILRSVSPECFDLAAGRDVPNHPDLPALLYRKIFEERPRNSADWFESRFRENDWGGCWRNGIFSYHHFHPTTHEVLGAARGWARVQLGGSEGPERKIEHGDVLVLPAGVGHCLLDSGGRFLVVGAYPGGRSWTVERTYSGSLEEVRGTLREVPLPEADPLYGRGGPLRNEWT